MFITARMNRYACLLDVRPPLPRIALAYHSRTTAPDAFVWLRLYQAQLSGLVPAGGNHPSSIRHT